VQEKVDEYLMEAALFETADNPEVAASYQTPQKIGSFIPRIIFPS
jgi:hypothetical protein